MDDRGRHGHVEPDYRRFTLANERTFFIAWSSAPPLEC